MARLEAAGFYQNVSVSVWARRSKEVKIRRILKLEDKF
jgi:hypothetical protein